LKIPSIPPTGTGLTADSYSNSKLSTHIFAWQGGYQGNCQATVLFGWACSINFYIHFLKDNISDAAVSWTKYGAAMGSHAKRYDSPAVIEQSSCPHSSVYKTFAQIHCGKTGNMVQL
jgi:hypothetical protein